MATDAEVLRLRERVHTLTTEVAENRLRIQGVETWQRKWEPVIVQTREADRIAAAVADTLEDRRRSWWQRWDGILASIAIVVTAGSAIGDILIRLHV